MRPYDVCNFACDKRLASKVTGNVDRPIHNLCQADPSSPHAYERMLSVCPAADMWVALAGPLTHVPMTIFWVCMLVAATFAAYGTTSISLSWPGLLTLHNLGVAVCVGAVVVGDSTVLQ